MEENGYWKVCAALACERRLSLVGFLLSAETTEFPSVSELAERFRASEPSMSVHLKVLANAGLVSSKRAERCVYYRAFPTTDSGARTLSALRDFFLQRPDAQRIRRLLDYAHALAHSRRNAIVRCLASEPGLSVKELSRRTEMPPQTADRLWSQLGKARIVDLNGTVVTPVFQPEATFLELTIGKTVSRAGQSHAGQPSAYGEQRAICDKQSPVGQQAVRCGQPAIRGEQPTACGERRASPVRGSDSHL